MPVGWEVRSKLFPVNDYIELLLRLLYDTTTDDANDHGYILTLHYPLHSVR